MTRSEALSLLHVGDRVSHSCHCLPGASSPSPPGPPRLFPRCRRPALICEIVSARLDSPGMPPEGRWECLSPKRPVAAWRSSVIGWVSPIMRDAWTTDHVTAAVAHVNMHLAHLRE